MAPAGHASPTAIAAISITFTTLAAVIVALRIVSRIFFVRNAGKDDIAILVAMASLLLPFKPPCFDWCLILSGFEYRVGDMHSSRKWVTTNRSFNHMLNLTQAHYGLGHHDSHSSPSDYVVALKLTYAAVLTYILAMSFTKASILLQYWRIFPQRSFRIACTLVSAMILAFALGATFSTLFYCIPVAAFWNPALLAHAHCLNFEAVWFGQAAGNIITDIAVAVLPLPFLRQLQVSRKQKIALMLLFALGGSTCIISIIRLNWIYIGAITSDHEWRAGTLALWSVVEVNTGILCSSLPTLKAILTYFAPQAFSSYQRSRNGRQSHSYALEAHERHSRNAFGTHLSNHKGTVQRNDISCGGQSLDIDAPEQYAASPKDIRVITVMEQEVERGRDGETRSEHGSTRHLVVR